MNRLVRIFLLAVTVSALVPHAASAATTPTPVGGARWTVTTIRVFDGTPPLYREGVNIALRAWNESRIGVSFVKTTNRRTAHVVIGVKPFPGMTAGTGTLGADRPARVMLDTYLVATEVVSINGTIMDLPGGAYPEAIAEVAAHELGHVLGLRHTTGCSLMTTTASSGSGCGLTRPDGQWMCRLVQRKDLLAMTRRYGGRGVYRASAFCPYSATLAGRVGAIAVGGATTDRAYRLDWKDTTNSYGFVVARSAAGGACPATPESGAHSAKLNGTGFEEQWHDSSIAPGSYCVSVWSLNGRGMRSAPRSVQVTVGSQADAKDEPIRSLSATVSGSTVQLSWDQQSGTTANRIYQYPNDGTCRVPSTAPIATAMYGEYQTTLSGVQRGSWTWAVTRSGSGSGEEDGDPPPSTTSPPVCTSRVVT